MATGSGDLQRGGRPAPAAAATGPRRRSLLIGAAAAGTGFACDAAPARDPAAQLAWQVYRRPQGRDLSTLCRIELRNRGREAQVREQVSYRLSAPGGTTASLIRLLEPDDIAGSGLLSVQRPGAATEHWLYLPALGRVHHVASRNKGGRFLGSDLYFEDVEARRPELDQHVLMGRDVWEGIPCDVLQSRPLHPASSVYRKRISWIDAEQALVLRVDYFERDDDTPEKRWTLETRRRIQNYWTPFDSRMTHLDSGHETRTTIVRAVYDRELPERLFTVQALADEKIEAAFRP